jgi:hypothetical protein
LALEFARIAEARRDWPRALERWSAVRAHFPMRSGAMSAVPPHCGSCGVARRRNPFWRRRSRASRPSRASTSTGRFWRITAAIGGKPPRAGRRCGRDSPTRRSPSGTARRR